MHWDFFQSALRMLLRMKWLFLSIIILYSFLLPDNSSDIHFIDRMLPVAYRILILFSIIFSVNLLIRSTTKNQIISAIYLLIKPLSRLGVHIESFLIRTYLTMDFVDKLNQKLKHQKQQSKKLLAFILSWFEQSVDEEINDIVIEKLSYPSFFQWTIPVLLCFCYILILIGQKYLF